MQSDPASIKMREITQEFLDFVLKQNKANDNENETEHDTSESVDDLKSTESNNGD